MTHIAAQSHPFQAATLLIAVLKHEKPGKAAPASGSKWRRAYNPTQTHQNICVGRHGRDRFERCLPGNLVHPEAQERADYVFDFGHRQAWVHTHSLTRWRTGPLHDRHCSSTEFYIQSMLITILTAHIEFRDLNIRMPPRTSMRITTFRFAATDAATDLQIIDIGVPKEHLALMGVLYFPLEVKDILLPQSMASPQKQIHILVA